MTSEEWNELICISKCLSIMPVLSEKTDRDVLKRIAITRDELELFIKENKPFEVEAGKEYVARFNMYLTNNHNSYRLAKGTVIVTDILSEENDRVWFSDSNNIALVMTIEQFENSFKPLENAKK